MRDLSADVNTNLKHMTEDAYVITENCSCKKETKEWKNPPIKRPDYSTANEKAESERYRRRYK